MDPINPGLALDPIPGDPEAVRASQGVLADEDPVVVGHVLGLLQLHLGEHLDIVPVVIKGPRWVVSKSSTFLMLGLMARAFLATVTMFWLEMRACCSQNSLEASAGRLVRSTELACRTRMSTGWSRSSLGTTSVKFDSGNFWPDAFTEPYAFFLRIFDFVAFSRSSKSTWWAMLSPTHSIF